VDYAEFTLKSVKNTFFKKKNVIVLQKLEYNTQTYQLPHFCVSFFEICVLGNLTSKLLLCRHSNTLLLFELWIIYKLNQRKSRHSFWRTCFYWTAAALDQKIKYKIFWQKYYKKRHLINFFLLFQSCGKFPNCVLVWT
jgi:hypothetical protein